MAHGEEVMAPKKARGHLGVLRKGSRTEKAKSQQERAGCYQGQLGYVPGTDDKEGGLPDASVSPVFSDKEMAETGDEGL